MPDAGAPAAPPDLTIKVQLFSEFGMVDKAKTEDWRLRGPLIKSTLVRPKVPVLFALPAMVEAGTIGKAMAKRPPPRSSSEAGARAPCYGAGVYVPCVSPQPPC